MMTQKKLNKRPEEAGDRSGRSSKRGVGSRTEGENHGIRILKFIDDDTNEFNGSSKD